MTEFSRTVRTAKADGDRQIAYGIVLEPRTADNPDTQGDWYTAAAIELAAHDFNAAVAKGEAWADLLHGEGPAIGYPVESFIAPVTYYLGDQVVKAGSWVMGMHYPDPEIWARVKKGELAAFSVGGTGTRSFE